MRIAAAIALSPEQKRASERMAPARPLPAPRRAIGNLQDALHQRRQADAPTAANEIFRVSSFANPLGRNQPNLQ
jgi:hypothetical protein